MDKNVKKLAGAMASKIEFINGSATVGNEVYYDNLPKDLDKKTVEAVHGYDDTYIASTALAMEQVLRSTDNISDIVGDGTHVTTSWGMGDHDTVSHTAVKSDDAWKVYTEVDHQLDNMEVLTDIQNNIKKLL